MKKILLFLMLLGSHAIQSMQPALPHFQANLRVAIELHDYERVKDLLYRTNFSQNQLQTALATAQGARQNTLPGEESRRRELDNIINLLKAFINFSARDAQIKRGQS